MFAPTEARIRSDLSRLLRGLSLAMFLAMLPQPCLAAPEGVVCSPEPTDMVVTYGNLVTCDISPIGDTDVFRFQGTVGETVRVQVVVELPECYGNILDAAGVAGRAEHIGLELPSLRKWHLAPPLEDA